MSSPYHIDAKSQLVITQSEAEEDFRLSLNNFPKKSSIEAVLIRYRAENMLLQAARDPKAIPKLEPEPTPPVITPEMSEEEVKAISEKFKKEKIMYDLSKQAAALMIPFDDFVHIKEHFIPFDRAINSLPGIKGKRWHSLTKNIGEEQQKRGLLGGGGGGKE